MGETGIPLDDRERLAQLSRTTRPRNVLIEMVRRQGWKRGAEIGVMSGATLFRVLDACPDLMMYGVDQWRKLPLRADECAETYAHRDMERLAAQAGARAQGYPGRCIILRGDSVAMADHVENESLDFVFIDGDHTEWGCARDIRAWAPKVRRGGRVLGHDHDWPTVRRVIDRLCPNWANCGEAVWAIGRDGVQL